MTDSRVLAYDILYKCEKSKAYSNIELLHNLSQSSLSQRDKSLVTAIVYGVLSRRMTLDAVISAFSSRPIEKLDIKTLTILRMGMYQLLFMDRIPQNAAVNESVELCKKHVNIGAAGMVNGILRSFLRQGFDFDTLSVSDKYSCSESICDMLFSQYGEKTTESIMQAFFSPRKTYVSVNTLNISADEFANKYSAVKIDDDICVLESPVDPDMCNGFVQDISSASAVKLLAPQPGDTIADLCAAPGGKSLKAAVMMQNQGRIFSFDIHNNKLKMIQKTAERLGISVIETKAADARELNQELIEKMDKVICDVPCSGLGVIARKPEIRYKDTDDFKDLYKTQEKILKNASLYLKIGGRLMYSTCTINKEENERQIQRFLSQDKRFKLIKEKLLLPTIDNDGFYAAIIERVRN